MTWRGVQGPAPIVTGIICIIMAQTPQCHAVRDRGGRRAFQNHHHNHNHDRADMTLVYVGEIACLRGLRESFCTPSTTLESCSAELRESPTGRRTYEGEGYGDREPSDAELLLLSGPVRGARIINAVDPHTPPPPQTGRSRHDHVGQEPAAVQVQNVCARADERSAALLLQRQ
ncbi:hypothetical protein EDC01DRAFT_746507 [Geopyxis carbonaria]|nr:hypothetical protein EDC01DRAFT_746507 [Geopyxis carbonaria]